MAGKPPTATGESDSRAFFAGGAPSTDDTSVAAIFTACLLIGAAFWAKMPNQGSMNINMSLPLDAREEFR